MPPNQITAHNAGGRLQFRFAGGVSWSGVCEFYRSARRCYENYRPIVAKKECPPEYLTSTWSSALRLPQEACAASCLPATSSE